MRITLGVKHHLEQWGNLLLGGFARLPPHLHVASCQHLRTNEHNAV